MWILLSFPSIYFHFSKTICLVLTIAPRYMIQFSKKQIQSILRYTVKWRAFFNCCQLALPFRLDNHSLGTRPTHWIGYLIAHLPLSMTLNHSRVSPAPTAANAKYPSATPFPPRKIYFATGLSKKTSQAQLIHLRNTILHWLISVSVLI